MRTLFALAALLVNVSAFATPTPKDVRNQRYDCVAYYADRPSAVFHGCSAWYPLSIWSDANAMKEAKDAAFEACGQASGGLQCYLMDCTMNQTDSYSPSWDCPLAE